MHRGNRRLGLESIQRFSVACVLSLGTSTPLIAQQAAPVLLDPVLGVRRTQLQSLSVARCDHAIIKLDATHLLVTGGAPSELITVAPLASCEIIDLKNGTCHAAAAMHAARRNHGIQRLNDGSVLVLGGQDEHGALASVERYLPDGDEWETLDPMKEARALFGLASLDDGRIVVAGGVGGSADLGVHGNGRALDGVEVLELLYGCLPPHDALAIWSELPPLRSARARPAMLRWSDGSLFVVGGLSAPASESISIFNGLNRGGNRVDHPTRAVERFDPLTKKWSNCADLPTGHDAAISATVLDEDTILVAACPWQTLREGESALEIFDVKTGGWSAASPLSVHDAQPWPLVARDVADEHSFGQLVESAGALLWFDKSRDHSSSLWSWNGEPREKLPDAEWSSYGTAAASLVLDGKRLLRVGGTWSGQGTKGVFLFEVDPPR